MELLLFLVSYNYFLYLILSNWVLHLLPLKEEAFSCSLMQVYSPWQANVIRKTTVLDVMRRLLQVRNFFYF